MTNEQLNEYIDELNSEYNPEKVFLRKISPTIDFAKFWTKEPNLSDKPEYHYSSYDFFFIKDQNDKYIGTVLDMGGDLHWYLKEKYRKQGILSKALKQTILPFIFYEREEQRITISKNTIGEKAYKNSISVANRLGFKPIDKEESEFILLKKDFDLKEEIIDWSKGKIENERLEVLRRKISYSRKLIKSVSDELLMKNLDDFELNEIAENLGKYLMYIEDIPYKKN